jgi:predicted lipoprotein with Yx(FWY)xxD motif
MSGEEIMKLLGRLAVVAATSMVFFGSAWAMHHEVKIAKGKDGSYLVDMKGMALYTFKKDTQGKSACAGNCVAIWPLYHQEKVGVSGDLKASDFATITREDGKKQTTYKGMPLYYYVEDKAAGETKGQGFKEVWFLATP